MRRFRNIKVLATLGPASSGKDTIRALFDADVDVFRLNFSHGSHEDHRKRYDTVCVVGAETGRPIGVPADMQGLKLRIGTFADGRVVLKDGDYFVFDRDPTPGDVTCVHLPHPELYAATAPGQSLLLDDGKIRLAVEAADPAAIVTRVVDGGPLSDRKGVNVPDAVIPIPTLTEKDLRDLDFTLSLGVDWIALSFVRRAEDVIAARKIIGDYAGLLSKIEKPAALLHLEDIVQASDALMVARGDLGVELPPECVPGVQKHILRMARQHGKPVVVATQVLESMIEASVSTRAKASDIASAVYGGIDAVMLSAESVSGKRPVVVVSIMNRIIVEAERDPFYRNLIDAQRRPLLPTRQDAVCAALRDVTHILGVVATVAYTSSDKTSLRATRERPLAPIVSITPRLDMVHRLAITWGVHSTASLDVSNVDETTDAACRAAACGDFAVSGGQIVITAGMSFGQAGSANLLRLAEVWPQTLVSAQTRTTALQPEPATV